MAKANVRLPDGTAVTIEGSPDEIAAFLRRFSENVEGGSSSSPSRQGPAPAARKRGVTSKSKAKGPIDYIRELAEADFFKAKRTLGDVKEVLAERAHFYPATSLSPALVRLVRRGELRRIKEDGAWKYVNP